MERGVVDFGEVVRGTLDTASRNLAAVAIYVVVLTVIGSGFDLLEFGWFDSAIGANETLATMQDVMGLGVGIGGIFAFFGSIVGQYFLWEAILRNAGLAHRLGRNRYLAFVGQAILILLATMIGFVLLIVPGLVMAARWMMAPALVVSSDVGLIEAMRLSWNTTKGNSTPVILVLLAIGLVTVVVAVGFGVASVNNPEAVASPVWIVLGQLMTQVQGALGVVLGMFLYQRLYDDAGDLVEAFE